MDAVSSKSHSKLINYIDDQKIQNVLIGNGFCLSHPKLSECFLWNREEILNKFSQEDFSTCFKKSNKIPSCPETFLYDLRLYFVECILKAYIKKLCSIFNSENIQGCQEENYNLSGLYSKYKKHSKASAEKFLTAFKNIFTVNYDPLIYFEMLRLKTENNVDVIDGFSGNLFKSQGDIINELNKPHNENKKKLYFLHGSWFIQAKARKDLRKISFGMNRRESYKVTDLFDWEKKRLPCLIFEDRSLVKKALIEGCAYFYGCLNALKNTNGSLLVFGMSFNQDDHLLDALMESQFEKIYFTYIDEKAKSSIKKKINGKNKLNKELGLLRIAPNIVWQE